MAEEYHNSSRDRGDSAILAICEGFGQIRYWSFAVDLSNRIEECQEKLDPDWRIQI